jgi:hypothetical protein
VLASESAADGGAQRLPRRAADRVNDGHSDLANAQETGRWRSDPDAHGGARREVNPAQRALYRGETRRLDTGDARIGCDAVSGTFDDTVQGKVFVRHKEEVRRRTGRNVAQLGFVEVRDDPPDARIDHGEDLSAGVHIFADRGGQIGDVAIEGGVDPTVVETVTGGTNRGGALLPLIGEWGQRLDSVGCLIALGLTLLDVRAGLYIVHGLH